MLSFREIFGWFGLGTLYKIRKKKKQFCESEEYSRHFFGELKLY